MAEQARRKPGEQGSARKHPLPRRGAVIANRERANPPYVPAAIANAGPSGYNKRGGEEHVFSRGAAGGGTAPHRDRGHSLAAHGFDGGVVFGKTGDDFSIVDGRAEFELGDNVIPEFRIHSFLSLFEIFFR